jgi:N-acetylglucosamine malate deacetylase 1
VVATRPLLLTVMAHPDDAELWAGGTIANHIHHGGSATIAVPRHDTVRDDEAAAGAHILGAALQLLDHLNPATIADLLLSLQPEVVITHPVHDIHPQHRQCAEHLLAALPDVVIAAGQPKRLYHCDSYNTLDQTGNPLYLPTIVDVTQHWDTKINALRAHSSQPIFDHFGPMADTLSRLHGGRIGVRHAEGFRPLPILGRLPACPAV